MVAQSKKADQGKIDNRYKLLDRAITKHHNSGYALIEILHVAQGIFGYLDNELLYYIANALKLPPSRVYGVATFYHFFRLKPQGKHTFVLCTGTACYVKGANEIQRALEQECKCSFGETTSDGSVSLISARCVGSCGLAPVAVIDDKVYGKMTVDEALQRVRELRETEKERNV
ncbi:MAG: bidirectional hydrogenase complex protein HoxE [Bacteroidetes bacterium]|nr:bidirectional hydrogenase complex protein HoxE [Bacteroidota bacterium]